MSYLIDTHCHLDVKHSPGELEDLIVPGHSEILMRKTIGPAVGFRKPATKDLHLLRGHPSPDITESVD